MNGTPSKASCSSSAKSPKTPVGRNKRNLPRFQTGDRVCWTTGNQKRSGTIIAAGSTREEAVAQIGKEYRLVYKSEKNRSGPFYYVAADTPLFKPGYSAHSIPERHLIPEKDDIGFKQEAALQMSATQAKQCAITVVTYLHEKKGRAPKELVEELHRICPHAFPIPQKTNATQKN